MKKIASILIFVLCVFWARAQNEEALILRARALEGKIYLRWGSGNADILKEGQKNGFLITKAGTNGKDVVLDVKDLKMEDPRTWQSDNDQVNVVKEAYAQMNGANTELHIVDQLQLQNNIFGLILFMADISMEAAVYTVTGFVDEDVKAGYNYSYTLSIPTNEAVPVQRIEISLADAYQNKPVENIVPEGGNLKAILKWDFSAFKDVYSCYILERSDDEGRTYTRISEAPFLPIINHDMDDPIFIANYEDDLEENGKEYYYRIAGIDFFAQQGPYSEIIKVSGKPDPIALNASIDKIISDEDGAFEIRWYLGEEWERKIKGFYLLRSTDGKQSYKRVSNTLGPSQRSFKDVSPTNISFYKIVTIDENGYELESTAGLAQKSDNSPPEAPKWKNGYIDSTGAVFLFWEENQEEDLGGYHVFYANSEHSEYSKLTNAAELEVEEYIDSVELKTLTKNIYYKLMAIDYRGNQSAYSEPLKLKRPDIIPPTPSVFKACTQEVDETHLRFTSSSSDDVLKTYLNRRKGNDVWETIHEVGGVGKTYFYIDSTANCKEIYSYQLISEDESGLKSFSDTIALSCIDSGKRPAIDPLGISQEGEDIHVKWEYDFYDEVKSILIYREVSGDKLRKIKQLWKGDITSTSQRAFLDKDVDEGKEYAYKIVIRFDDNGFASSEKSAFFKLKKE